MMDYVDYHALHIPNSRRTPTRLLQTLRRAYSDNFYLSVFRCFVVVLPQQTLFCFYPGNSLVLVSVGKWFVNCVAFEGMQYTGPSKRKVKWEIFNAGLINNLWMTCCIISWKKKLIESVRWFYEDFEYTRTKQPSYFSKLSNISISLFVVNPNFLI